MGSDVLDSGGAQQQDVKRVFAEVCDLDSETRQSRLDELCCGDLQLRWRVERLLQHDDAYSIFEVDLEGDDSQ